MKHWKIMFAKLNYQIPVALSFVFPVKFGNACVNIIWIVIPYESSTDIMVLLNSKVINEETDEKIKQEAIKKLSYKPEKITEKEKDEFELEMTKSIYNLSFKN